MTFAQRRTMAVALASIAIACGLVWRLGRIPLPFFAYKYGVSMLWALAIYWLVCTAAPRWNVAMAAAAAALFSISIEFFKLYHSTAMDAFRLTLAGKLILGRVFSWKDIAAYVLAIVTAALLDNALLYPKAAKPSKA